MFDPPTDRLHKFLAVGGLLLILAGIVYPLHQYQAADTKRIEMIKRARLAGYSYNRFAALVNQQAAIRERIEHQQRVGGGTDQLERQLQLNKPELDKLDREVQSAIVEMQEQADLAKHHYFMRNVWLILGGLCILVGSVFSTLGFRQWLAQPKRVR